MELVAWHTAPNGTRHVPVTALSNANYIIICHIRFVVGNLEIWKMRIEEGLYSAGHVTGCKNRYFPIQF